MKGEDMRALSVVLVAIVAVLPMASAVAQEGEEDPLADVKDMPAADLRAGGNEMMRYFLVGPKAGSAEPEVGWALLVVLPGGDGSAEFNPFVRRIAKFALPEGYLVVQPVAPMWTANQEVTWPTAKLRVAGQRFTTEEFLDAVVAEVSKKHKVDAKRVFTLSWSSGGPAAYYAGLRPKTPITGSLIAMSVFKVDQLPAGAVAKDKAFYILHSPEDKVCPFWMARTGYQSLRDEGARAEFAFYSGGHGWSSGDPYGDIRAGIDWLEMAVKAETAAEVMIENALPFADGFETGLYAPRGWAWGEEIEGVTYVWDREAGSEGKASLGFDKTGNKYFPIARWLRPFAYDGKAQAVKVSAKVKAEKAAKAILNVIFFDAKGAMKWDWAAYIGAQEAGAAPVSHDWKEYSGTVKIPSGTTGLGIGLEMYGPGSVRFDELKVEYAPAAP
jgi:predicted esterase